MTSQIGFAIRSPLANQIGIDASRAAEIAIEFSAAARQCSFRLKAIEHCGLKVDRLSKGLDAAEDAGTLAAIDVEKGTRHRPIREFELPTSLGSRAVKRQLPLTSLDPQSTILPAELIVAEVIAKVIIQQVNQLGLITVAIQLNVILQVLRIRMAAECQPDTLEFNVVLVGVRTVRVEERVTQLDPTVDAKGEGHIIGTNPYSARTGQHEAVVIAEP